MLVTRKLKSKVYSFANGFYSKDSNGCSFFIGMRRDSIKSDATLTSSFLIEMPSGYNHKDKFVKGKCYLVI